MLIYLIEDDPQKTEKIATYVRELSPTAELRVLRSYQSGLKEIEKETPNFIVMDMTLPTFDMTGVARHGRPRSLGGYEIMRKIKLRGLSIPTFVISALETFGDGKITFEEIRGRCQDEFPGTFLGATFFRLSSDEWKPALKEAILKMGQ